MDSLNDLDLNRNANCKECARFLGVGLTKFWELTKVPDFPKAFRYGRLCRWPLNEVQAWRDKVRASGDGAANVQDAASSQKEVAA